MLNDCQAKLSNCQLRHKNLTSPLGSYRLYSKNRKDELATLQGGLDIASWSAVFKEFSR